MPFQTIMAEKQLRNYRRDRSFHVHPSITRAYAVELAIRLLHSYKIQPTPGRIQRELDDHITKNLNGRDCKVYAKIMEELDYERVNVSINPRWQKKLIAP